MTAETTIAPIIEKLAYLRRGIRTIFLINAVSRVTLFLASFFSLTFFLDWLFVLPKELRLIVLAMGLAWLGYLIIRRIIYPLSLKISDEELALAVERVYPLGDSFISAVELLKDRSHEDFNSPELVNYVVEEAVEKTGGLDFGGVVTKRHIMKAVFAALAVTLAAGAFALSSPNLTSIYFARLLGFETRWPRATTLKVLDFEGNKKIVASGDDVTISIKASGAIPQKATLYYEFKSGERGAQRMVGGQDKGIFNYTFSRVTVPFNFWVEGGDDKTDKFYIETLIPPRLELATHWYEYPAYVGLENTPRDKPEQGGDLRAPIGTIARIAMEFNQEISSARLTLGRGEGQERVLPMKTAANKIEGEFTITEASSSYSITATAKNGLANREPIRFPVIGMLDNAPMITVKNPTTDEYITDVAVRPLSIETKDDYAVMSVLLTHKTLSKSAEEKSVVFGPAENTPAGYGAKSIASVYNFDAAKVKPEIGSIIEYYYSATDNKMPTPNLTKTKPYRFIIMSVSELEKRLAADIEAIKSELRVQKKSEEGIYSRTSEFIKKFSSVPTEAEKQELKSAELDQTQIRQRLEATERKLSHILKQGVYNKIFDSKSVSKLEQVKGIIAELVGSTVDASAGFLKKSALSKSSSELTESLENASKIEKDIIMDLDTTLALLEEWATYQDVVRTTRELLEAQKKIDEGIKPK